MPTPARSATSSSGAEVPFSVKSARAAATSLSWFARASARWGRWGWVSVWLIRSDKFDLTSGGYLRILSGGWLRMFRRSPPFYCKAALKGVGMQDARPGHASARTKAGPRNAPGTSRRTVSAVAAMVMLALIPYLALSAALGPLTPIIGDRAPHERADAEPQLRPGERRLRGGHGARRPVRPAPPAAQDARRLRGAARGRLDPRGLGAGLRRCTSPVA